MPARTERIYLFPSDINQPARVVQFPVWWDGRELFNQFATPSMWIMLFC